MGPTSEVEIRDFPAHGSFDALPQTAHPWLPDLLPTPHDLTARLLAHPVRPSQNIQQMRKGQQLSRRLVQVIDTDHTPQHGVVSGGMESRISQMTARTLGRKQRLRVSTCRCPRCRSTRTPRPRRTSHEVHSHRRVRLDVGMRQTDVSLLVVEPSLVSKANYSFVILSGANDSTRLSGPSAGRSTGLHIEDPHTFFWSLNDQSKGNDLRLGSLGGLERLARRLTHDCVGPSSSGTTAGGSLVAGSSSFGFSERPTGSSPGRATPVPKRGSDDYPKTSNGPDQSGTKKRGRLQNDKDKDPDEDSEDEGDDEEPEEKRQRSTNADDLLRKFACPFFKFDPKTYGDKRVCMGPGWRSLHRVKCAPPAEAIHATSCYANVEMLGNTYSAGTQDLSSNVSGVLTSSKTRSPFKVTFG